MTPDDRVETWPPPSPPRPPDPLDDAVYHYPSVTHHPFGGRPSGWRWLTPRLLPRWGPGRTPMGRATRTWMLTITSLIDGAAFIWSALSGPLWLVPVALAGLVATALHLALLVRRLHSAGRQPLLPSLSPIATLSPAGSTGRSEPRYARFSARSNPLRRPPLLGRLVPSTATLPLRSSTTIVAGISVVAALVVHVSIVNPRAIPFPELPFSTTARPLPAALYISPAPGRPLTRLQATSIIDAAWQTREEALVQRELGLLGELETGGAQAVDGEYLEDLAYGQAAVVYTAPRPIDDVDTDVPQPSGYPAYFAGTVSASPTTLPTHATAMMVLTKANAQSPWRITLMDDGGGTQNGFFIPQPLVNAGTGYDTFYPGDSYWFGPTTPPSWLGELAQYYATWKDTGHAPDPDPFDGGLLTDQKGKELTSNPPGTQFDGALLSYHFATPSPGEQWLLGWGGLSVECGNLTEQVFARPVQAGGRLYQQPNRVSWGPDIPPGTYTSVTTTWVYGVCVEPDLKVPGHFNVFGDLDSVAGESATR